MMRTNTSGKRALAALASVAPHRFGGDAMLLLRLAGLLLVVVLMLALLGRI